MLDKTPEQTGQRGVRNVCRIRFISVTKNKERKGTKTSESSTIIKTIIDMC